VAWKYVPPTANVKIASFVNNVSLKLGEARALFRQSRNPVIRTVTPRPQRQEPAVYSR